MMSKSKRAQDLRTRLSEAAGQAKVHQATLASLTDEMKSKYGTSDPTKLRDLLTSKQATADSLLKKAEAAVALVFSGEDSSASSL